MKQEIKDKFIQCLMIDFELSKSIIKNYIKIDFENLTQKQIFSKFVDFMKNNPLKAYNLMIELQSNVLNKSFKVIQNKSKNSITS